MKIAIVNRQDLARVRLFDWLAEEDCRGVWQVYTGFNGQRILLEEVILGYDTQQFVDHVGGDDFNFRRENLEIVLLEEFVERRIRRVTGVTVEMSERVPF